MAGLRFAEKPRVVRGLLWLVLRTGREVVATSRKPLAMIGGFGVVCLGQVMKGP